MILLLPVLGFSQGEWNKWFFGQGIAVDFISGNPVLLPNSAMYTPGMTACISDSLGNILFYSTGIATPRFKFFSNSSGIYYPHGAEFSVDSKFIYTCSNDTILSTERLISQFDLTKTDSSGFMQSEVALGYAGMNLRLSSNGKIYITDAFNYGAPSDSFHVINNPTLQGTACNFQKCVFGLGGSWAQHSLPQFLQKYKAYIHKAGDCSNQPTHFSGDIWPAADSIHWDFGDPTSGPANYSNDTTPSHHYTLPGQYTVELFVRHIDNRTDTSWVTITIYETPDPELGPDQTICQGDSVTLDAGSCSGCVYEWFSIPPGYSSTEQLIIVNLSGAYIVSVTSPGGCTGKDTVELTMTFPPVITNTPLSKSICSGESTNIPLASSVPNTEFSWTASASSPMVIGYGPGSGDTIDQVMTNISATPEIVTYSITPSIGSCQGDSVQYVVTVTPGDSVLVSIVASVDSICEGTQVTYTASPTHEGSAPNYHWMVNGINQGVNNAVFSYFPLDNDTIYCVLTSSEQCPTNNPATSDTITMVVNPLLSVEINITVFANPVCEGLPVTVTATPINGGAMPAYQWQVNGINTGTNNPDFTYTPVDGDIVACTLTSNEECIAGNPAISNPITMSVVETPVVSFTGCFDTITTLNAKPFKLIGGIPSGGTYSGPGVSNGYFYPGIADSGTHQITYSYTNYANCEASATNRSNAFSVRCVRD